MSGASAAQRDSVARRIQTIVEGRVRASEREGFESYSREQTEDLLSRAADLPSGCKRDVVYARAALSVGHSKDFTRAFEVIGRVENKPIRDVVLQFLYYDLSLAAVAGADVDGALSLARDLDDASISVRSTIAITKAMIKRDSGSSPTY